MRSRVNVLEGPIYKQILLFFFPILFGTFFQQLYNTVDAVVVGNFVGKEALGAVGGSTGTLINLLVGLITGIASGATVVIAQYYGNRDREKVQKGVRTGMFLAILLGAIIMVVGIYFAKPLLVWMDVPSDILPYSITYMRIYFVGLIPSMIYNMGAGVLRAIGDSKRPLYFLIISCGVNIVLDILFVVVLHLDVTGVGLATIISQFVSCVLTLYVLKHSEDSYRFEMKELSVDYSVLYRIILIGIPTGLQSCMYSISNVFIQATVNGFGTDSVAAFTAFGKIDSLFWMMSGAYGTALMTFVGQNFGAKNIERVKEGAKAGIIMMALTTVVMSVGLYFFGEIFYRLFTPDLAVIDIGMVMLRFLCPTWITFVLIEIFSSTIRACGDSFVPMLITGVFICGTRLLWLFSFEFDNIIHALYCYPISWSLASIIFLVYYKEGSWLKRCIKKAH